MSRDDDEHFMSLALAEASHGQYSASPNPAVGCVLVNNGKVISRGYHRAAGEPHAEINALQAAGEAARGAVAYVTLEPCNHQGRTGPCTEAIIASGVRRVVYALDDPNPAVDGGGAARLRDAGIEVSSAVGAAQAAVFHRGYLTRVRHGRPYVCIKIAMSLDGRTALADGQSQWITGSIARAEVQRLRARSCAVMTGVGTILCDDPALTVRDATLATGGRQPCRIVLDSALRAPPGAQTLSLPGETIIMTTATDAGRMAALQEAGARVERVEGKPRPDLRAVLAHLGQLEMNEVLVEAGPTLVGSLIAADCFDQLVVHVAPKLLGAEARTAFNIPSPALLTDAMNLRIVESKNLGEDISLTLERRQVTELES